MAVRINHGKESNKVPFFVGSIKKETGTNIEDEWNNKSKQQIMYGLGSQFKGIYEISVVNPPKNRSITMRMYTIEKYNKFKLKYTQKVSPGQSMEIPRLKGVREYAFTYSVDGKESNYHVFLWDNKYKYYEDDFIVKNYSTSIKEPDEKVVKTEAALKSSLINILSKKKDEFVTIDNKSIEKYFKENQFPDALLTKLFTNKTERAKYKKLLNNYHCWRSYSKKYDSMELHIFPLRSYTIERN
jgi:hypothetical protein